MIYVLIPVFNEEKNLPQLLNDLHNHEHNHDFFYVFSDDGSSDKSKEVIEDYFKLTNTASYIILGDGQNFGPGHAFNIGFEWILLNSKNENDLVLTLEADNTSDKNLITPMIALSKGSFNFDMVLASVYIQGGGFSQTNWLRKLLSFTANYFIRMFFDIKIQTLSSFYRLYKISTLRDLKAKYPILITESGFICMVEILIKAININATMIEYPMLLKSDNRVGKSKMKIIKTTRSYIKFFWNKKF